MLQSAIKLVDSFNSKREHRSALVRSIYQALPNERSAFPQGFKTGRRSSQRENSWTSLAALNAPDPSRRPFGWHTCTFRNFCSNPREQFGRSDAINQRTPLRSLSTRSRLLQAD
ncbi:hypothetical protein CF319_g8979 [Tilletia indica]|nr:hypothetical protein CF319_g8979 [Tilletia indica]